jgi:hypothetical protein
MCFTIKECWLLIFYKPILLCINDGKNVKKRHVGRYLKIMNKMYESNNEK